MSVYFQEMPDAPMDQSQLYQDLMLKYVNLETGNFFESQEEMMSQRIQLGYIISKFTTRFNCRRVHAFRRPNPRLHSDQLATS
jgi:hypothetical protein